MLTRKRAISLLMSVALIVALLVPMTVPALAVEDDAGADAVAIIEELEALGINNEDLEFAPMTINGPVADVICPEAQPWYNQAFAGEPAGFRPDRVPEVVNLSAPENAVIFYNLAVVDVADGAAPSQAQIDAVDAPTMVSTVYTGPISLAAIDKTHAVVIKAFSVTTAGGLDTSPVATFVYFQRLWVLTDVKTLADGTLNDHTQKVPNAWTSFVLDQVVSEMTQRELATMTGGSVNGQEYNGVDNPFRGAPTTTNGTINSNPNVTGWADVRLSTSSIGTDLGISRLCIPTTVMVDGPAGVRDGRYSTAWVVATALASSWDRQVQYDFASSVANEAAYAAYDMMLAPATNIHRSPIGGRNFEYYSEDPYISYVNTLVYTDAMLEKRVGVSLKHYMANDQENNRNNVSSTVSERALREIMGYPFMRVCEESDPYCMMSIYGVVNQTRASDHSWMIDQLPREQWGFQGYVQTDWGNHWDPHSMAARLNQHQPTNNYSAGNNFMNYENGVNGTPASDETKAIRTAIMRRNARDILVSKIKMPIFNNLYDDLTSDITQQRRTQDGWLTNPDSPALESERKNRDLAAKCQILLKNNEVNGVPALPLTGADKKNLTLVYSSSVPNSTQGNTDFVVQGGGSGAVTWARGNPRNPTIYQALTSEEFGYSIPNYVMENNAALNAENVEATAAAYAAGTDVGIMIISRTSSEGSDRTPASFGLNANELRVLPALYNAFKAAGKPFIVITNMGGNIDTTQILECSDAILHISAAGQQGGLATADVLSGKVNPSGKTVDSWPLTYSDTVPMLAAAYFTEKGMMEPSLANYTWAETSSYITAIYAEDNLIGYRFYETIAAIDPEFKVEDHIAFPFGFGLSYTTFEYSNLRLNKDAVGTANDATVKATVTVTNTGEVPGRTAVELYLGASTFEEEGRPVRELKNYGMTKVLKPGESEDISFTIEKRDLCYFDDGTSMDNNYGRTWKPWRLQMNGTGVNAAVIPSSDPKFAAYAHLQLWGSADVTLGLFPNGGYGLSEELNQIGYTRTSYNGVDAYTTYNGFYGDDGHTTGWRVDPGTVFTVQIGDSSNTKDLEERGVSAEFTYGEYGSIAAPEIWDIDSTELSYDISVGQVRDTNFITVTAQFDNTRLDYVGSTPSSGFALLSDKFDPETGLYTAKLAIMSAGTLFSTEDLAKIVTANFSAKPGVEYKDVIEGSLVTLDFSRPVIGEALRTTFFKPGIVFTVVDNYMRWDINGDGKFTTDDVATIIYLYYGALSSDPNWNDAKVYDADKDGIVALVDILTILSFCED